MRPLSRELHGIGLEPLNMTDQLESSRGRTELSPSSFSTPFRDEIETFGRDHLIIIVSITSNSCSQALVVSLLSVLRQSR